MKTRLISISVISALLAAALCGCGTQNPTVSGSGGTLSSDSLSSDNVSAESSSQSAESQTQPTEDQSLSEVSPFDGITAQVRTDKEFWAALGTVSYDGRKICFADDFDTLKLCTDESVGKEIIDRVNRQWQFNRIVDFPTGYKAVKGAAYLSNAEDISSFTEENLIDGEYFEADPDFFSFSDMKGFYEKASELYTGFDYDSFTSFIPSYYAEKYGKLCIAKSHAFGEKGGSGERYDLAQYLIIYDGEDENSMLCICAMPDIASNNSVIYQTVGYHFVKTDAGLRCKVSSTIANFGMCEDFSVSKG